ncbi:MULTISPECIES: hypothetical protein [Photorhabdus]|nr:MULTISPECIES: hypothetical protein [Photorhabdus]MCT8350513.1 hypothetical protein [Photorhabdus kayaii]MDB6366590.1 hypothetical protein [Photorhabdus bodei]
MTGVRECSQQRGNLKDDGYKLIILKVVICHFDKEIYLLQIAHHINE